LEAEKEIDRLNNRGWFFGAAWIMGLGSIVTIISLIQAYKLYKKFNISDEKRKRTMIRNLVIAIIGLSVWIPIVILFINKN
jgi:chromate transport protein ChrA